MVILAHMSERQADEVLSFELPDLSATVKKLKAIEQKCKEVRGEIHASKQGVNQIRVSCVWDESWIKGEDLEDEEEEEEV